MNSNATLKNLTSVQNLLLFWLSIVASGTFFQRYTKLSLLRFNCIYKSFSLVYDLLKKASLKKAKTTRLIPR